MTVGELFDLLRNNPNYIIGGAAAVMVVLCLLYLVPSRKRYQSPWKFIYTLILYTATVPAIFVVTLFLYYFLFERSQMVSFDFLLHGIPLLLMVVTYAIVKNQVKIAYIPGFGRLTSIITLVALVLIFLWFFDRVHIFTVTLLPLPILIGILVGGIILFRIMMTRMLK